MEDFMVYSKRRVKEEDEGEIGNDVSGRRQQMILKQAGSQIPLHCGFFTVVFSNKKWYGKVFLIYFYIKIIK